VIGYGSFKRPRWLRRAGTQRDSLLKDNRATPVVPVCLAPATQLDFLNGLRATGNEMNRRHVLLGAFAAAAMPRAALAADPGPTALVTALYAVQAAALNGGPKPTATSQRGKFFDDNLVELLEGDGKYAAIEQGMGRLNFDPFYGGQDFKITNLKIGQAAIDGNKARLLVHFNNFGTPQELMYRLVRQGAGWRISNISQQLGGPKWDLVSVLEGKE
jgi:hypothetical protein